MVRDGGHSMALRRLRLRPAARHGRGCAAHRRRARPRLPGHPGAHLGGRSVRTEVAAEPAVVVATPGAEPVATDGYAAALLLDTWALLGRADLRAAEEALRRWMAASALVRRGRDGGQVVLVGDAADRSVQALVRWDPVRFAESELADRVAVGLPPARRLAVLRGAGGRPPGPARPAVPCPPGTEQLGPVAVPARAVGLVRDRTSSRWCCASTSGTGAELGCGAGGCAG